MTFFINGYLPGTTEHMEYARQTRRLTANRKFCERRKAGAKWLTEEHDFVLMRGDDCTGRTMRMQGGEAKRLNGEYEEKFYKALDTNKGARLYRWKWNEPMPEGKKRIPSRRKGAR